MSVQQVVRLLTERLTQEFLIEFLDIGVLVTLAQLLASVLSIEGIAASLENLDVAMVIGLTGTANTAAGAALSRCCHGDRADRHRQYSRWGSPISMLPW